MCGRPVTVSANLQGRIVACGHCGGKFHVSAESAASGSSSHDALLERIDALLRNCRA